MTKDEQVQRGIEAEQLLNNPLLKEFLELMDKETIKQLDKAPIFGFDIRKRQQQIIMLRQVKNRFVKHLETCVNTGKLARDRSLKT